MYGTYFYHNTIRTYHKMIGTLFNDISIKRYDKTGAVTKTLEVPIAFAPKEEYIRFLKEGGVDKNGVQIVLPRMSFQLDDFSYAPDRMQTPMERLRYSNTDDGARSQYMPVPYDFNFTLSVYTKHMDDGFQIVEQIAPYFNPTVNWPVKDLPELDDTITHDIAIEMTGNAQDFEFEGTAEDDDRFLNWDMNFTLRGFLFRPSGDNGLIKKSLVNFYDLSDYGQPADEQFKQVEIEAKVDPESADPDDPHEIITTTTENTGC